MEAREAKISRVGIQRHDQGKEVSGQWCAGEWLTGSFGEGSNL